MDHAQYTTLMDVLNQVPDYRKRKGRLHRWMTVLRLIAMGLASAQRTPQAIARWIGEHRTDLFAVLPPTVSGSRAVLPFAVRWHGPMSPRWNQL